MGDLYKKKDRELIKYKTKAMLELEEELKDIQLSFNIKTVHLKSSESYNEQLKKEFWWWHKTYYEILFIENGEKEILKFYAKKGYQTLSFYLYRAFHTGGDEE